MESWNSFLWGIFAASVIWTLLLMYVNYYQDRGEVG